MLAPKFQVFLQVLAVRTVTFAVWALAAASVAYWGLKLWAAPAPSMTAPVARSQGLEADPAVVARALGAMKYEAVVAQAPPMASRFALLGMVSDAAKRGVALIAVDGKPAKPVRVGAVLEEGVVLQSVDPQRATFGADGASAALFVLDMPVVKK
jgi:general secretion pathway protein C